MLRDTFVYAFFVFIFYFFLKIQKGISLIVARWASFFPSTSEVDLFYRSGLFSDASLSVLNKVRAGKVSLC